MDITGHTIDTRETTRLATVALYESESLGLDEVFARYTRLAAQLFGVPMASIALVEADSVCFRSRFGPVFERLPRGETFCNTTIQSDQPLIVADTMDDRRFATCGLVTGPAGLRFYGGAPLITPDGERIGALCLLDTRPHHDFGVRETAMLGELARSVMAEFELLRRLAEKRDLLAELSFRQELADLAAHAPDLTTALDCILRHAAERFDAVYCAVPEADIAAATYRYAAAYTADPRFDPIFVENHQAAARPLASLSAVAALAGRTLVDSGPLDDPATLDRYPALQAAVRLGARRQITLPLPIAHRHCALMIGFRDATVSPRIMRFCAHFADWVAPLLQGRLREDALARSHALLDRSNRALQTLFAASETIAGAADEAALVHAICERAVTIGRYCAAWVGYAEHDDARTLRPVAMAGTGIETIWQARILWSDTIHGRGPSGTAVREGRPVVIADLNANPAFAPWRQAANLAGYAAAIALPLHDPEGVCFGCLTLYVTDRGPGQGVRSVHDAYFNAEETRLLVQLAGNLAFGIAALRTRTARDLAVASRLSSEQRLARLLEASPTLVYALERRPDGAGATGWFPVEFSANLERMFGHTTEAALQPDWWLRNLHPEDREAACTEVRQQLRSAGRVVQRYRFAHADGTYRWVRDEKSLVRDADGEPVRIIGAWVDITEKQRTDEELHRLAYSDPLTGLPNRAMLRRQLESAFDRAVRTNLTGALLSVGLNGFKTINDLNGHTVGDAVLDQVGRRIRSALRARDVVARMGGDEFIVLLAGLGHQAERSAKLAYGIANKLHQALEPVIRAAGHDCHITARIGIALFPQEASGIDDILRQADIAMDQARTAERAADQPPTMVFEPAMHDQVAHRHTVEQALRDALEHDRFEVWLQPQVDCDGTLVGAEALIRLRRADGVIVPPGEFIPVAEETGIVLPMGRWMLRAVCGIMAERRSGGQPLQISINVSPRQFRDPRFIGEVEAVLAETGADPRDLMIEITEGVLIDRIEEITAKLSRLAALGIRFSVDDFGTGYSSLGYLQNLPIAEIKIDRSFIRRLPDCARDATLAEAILAMTRHLGLSTVAEGVETEAQADFLRARHCNIMQGYLFGRPEPAPVWLRRWDLAEAESRRPGALPLDPARNLVPGPH